MNNQSRKPSCIFLLLSLLFAGADGVAQASFLTVGNPSNCGLNAQLSDNNCPQDAVGQDFPDVLAINVTTAPGSSLGTDVYLSEVRLLLNHTWIGDVSIELESPGGARINLITNRGGTEDNLGDGSAAACAGYARFTYASCNRLVNGTPPYADRPYRPEQDLAALNDGSNPVGTWKMYFCDDLQADIGVLQYVELVFAPLTCLPVLNPLIVSKDTTGLTLTYDGGANDCAATLVEFGPPGFTPGTGAAAGTGGQVMTLGCSPATLDLPLPNTAYEIYLRSFCPATAGYGENSCPVSLTTDCRPPATTYLTTFDDESSCPQSCPATCVLAGDWRNAAGNLTDWSVNAGPTPTAATGPADDITGGGKYLYLEANGLLCAPQLRAELRSPCFELNKMSSDECHLSFSYHMQGSTMGSLTCEITTDGGVSWQPLWQRTGNQGPGWQRAYLSLAAYPDGQLFRIRFVGRRGNGIFSDLAIDHIKLHGSQSLGYPTARYHADTDGDGYGNPQISIESCLPNPPAGFVPDNTDCDDTRFLVNPGAAEVPCNQRDDNCSGNQNDDDGLLPPAVVFNDTVCFGSTATLTAQPYAGQLTIWYDVPTGGFPLTIGNSYTPVINPAVGPDTARFTYYVAYGNLNTCASAQRTPATIVVLPQPRASLIESPSSCAGDTFDLADLAVRDLNFTNPTTTFFDPATGQPITQLLVAPQQNTDYGYVFTSPAGCTDTGLFTLTVTPRPLIGFSPADTIRPCAESDVQLTVVDQSGPGPFSFAWSTGQTDSIITIAGDSGAAIRTFGLTLTDSRGCATVDTAVVIPSDNLSPIAVTAGAVSSCLGTDGSLLVVPQAGIPPYTFTYEGSDGSGGTQTGVADSLLLNGLAQGTYQITVTDASSTGCSAILRNLRVLGPGFTIDDISTQDVGCNGAATGSACINIGGTGTAVFSWPGGQTTACVDSLAAGKYDVTISNAGCSTVESIIIGEPGELRYLSLEAFPSCFDATDGSISLRLFGGATPYMVDWSTGASGTSLPDLGAGDYGFTVTDSRGCTLVDSVFLPAPDTLRANLTALTPISCSGAADGRIELVAEGGQPPYTYTWLDGAPPTGLRTDLAPGTYQLLLTDVAGCTISRDFTLTDPLPVTVSAAVIDRPLCRGEAGGTITLTPAGGVGGYLYSWSDNFFSGNPNRTGLVNGLYRVSARDANGCLSDTLTVALTPTVEISAAAALQMPACAGSPSGAIDLTVSGPGTFSYLWSDGSTAGDRTGLTSGTYQLTLTSSAGCSLDTGFVLTAPQAFQFTTVVRQPSCAGSSDGIIDNIFVPSGNPPYQFFWNDGSQHVDQLGLSGGDWVFTVTDGIGCRFVSDTFLIRRPPPLELVVTDVRGPSCAGGSDGFLATAATGGTPPYTWNWVGTGVTDAGINGLSGGMQRLVLRDARNCTIDTLLAVPTPAPLTLAVTRLTATDICLAGGRDSLVVSVTGGAPPYTYLWTDGSTSDTLIPPADGTYRVVVQDARGCRQQSNGFKIRDVVPPFFFTSFDLLPQQCFEQNDAALSVSVSGGSGLYVYQFSTGQNTLTDSTAQTAAGLGYFPTYGITVTDGNTGCTYDSTIVAPPFPQPLTTAAGVVTDENCAGAGDGSASVQVFGGTPPYAYAWYDAGEISSVRIPPSPIWLPVTTPSTSPTRTVAGIR